LNGLDIVGATSSTLAISNPYGIYTCYTISIDGCKVETSPLSLSLVVTELENSEIMVYPNPSVDYIHFSKETNVLSVAAIDLNGKEIILPKNTDSQFDIRQLSSGVYTLKIETQKGKTQTKLVKQ
jgi:hypothetical protein